MRRAILIGLVAVLAACGGPDVSTDGPGEEGEQGRPGRIDELDCPPNAGCIDGTVVDGTFYPLSDCPPAPEEVLGAVIATPGTDERFDEARSVEGFAPSVVVAVDPAADVGCRDRTARGWILVYGGEARTEEEALALAEARCELPAVPLDGCAEGIGWRDDGSVGEDQNVAWRPEVVASINERLDRGEPVPGHGDPVDAVAVEVMVPDARSLDDRLLFRIGVEIEEEIQDRAVVVVLYQYGMLYNGDEPGYSMIEERWGVERLGGGPGWFVTSKRSGTAGEPVLGDPGRQAADQRWARCCDRVLVDHEAP